MDQPAPYLVKHPRCGRIQVEVVAVSLPELALAEVSFVGSLLGRFLARLEKLLAPKEEDGPEYDLEHLEHRRFRYVEVLDVDGDEIELRCNLCARLFDDVDETFEHVASHDDQVGEAIDPFDARLPMDRLTNDTDTASTRP